MPAPPPFCRAAPKKRQGGNSSGHDFGLPLIPFGTKPLLLHRVGVAPSPFQPGASTGRRCHPEEKVGKPPRNGFRFLPHGPKDIWPTPRPRAPSRNFYLTPRLAHILACLEPPGWCTSAPHRDRCGQSSDEAPSTKP